MPSPIIPKVFFYLDGACVLLQPCLLNEYGRFVVQFPKGKKDCEEVFDNCFHLDFLGCGGGSVFPLPLVELEDDCFHIVGLDGHAQRHWLITLAKLTGKAERFNRRLCCQFAVEVVFHLRLERQTAGGIEASVVASLVFNVEGVFHPLSPRKTSVLFWQGSILASFDDDFLIVIFHPATDDDGGDFLDHGGFAFAGLELLSEDGGKVCSLVGLDDVFDVCDVHLRFGFSIRCHLIGWLCSVASFETAPTFSQVFQYVQNYFCDTLCYMSVGIVM